MIISDIKLDFKDVLLVPSKSNINSRKDVNLEVTYNFKYNKNIKWTGVPIISSNMDTTGTFEIAKELYKYKMLTSISKHYSYDEWICFKNSLKSKEKNIFNYITITTGILSTDLIKLDKILSELKNIKFISIDIANGYISDFLKTIKQIRNKYPDKIIMAGTVVTSDIIKDILDSGADIIRIGIGGGSVCTTREKTGVGYPQLSSILECYTEVRKHGGLLVSDGGCSIPGDFCKAFGAGADFVMAGGIFSGHEESSGNIIINDNGVKMKEFYGMASSTAIKKYNTQDNYRTSEGKRVIIEYKGYIENTIIDILGGIRSCCSYVGYKNLHNFISNGNFIKVNRQLNNVYSRL